MSRLQSLLAIPIAAAALVGCASGVGEVFDSRQNVGPCPPAGSIYDSARIIVLEGGESFSNIAYTGEINGVTLFCRYVGADPLEAEIDIDFAFGRGPQGEADEHVYEYFVAVTRRSGAVLAKESFLVEADFSDGSVDAVRERIPRITIPRADETISGVNFEILVGFVLTDEQLEFNRAGKRFRLDANTGS